MSSASDHHAKAEELLEKARTARGEAGRSLILAEAQVHATLALAATTTAGRTSAGSRTRTESAIGEVTPVSANRPL